MTLSELLIKLELTRHVHVLVDDIGYHTSKGSHEQLIKNTVRLLDRTYKYYLTYICANTPLGRRVKLLTTERVILYPETLTDLPNIDVAITLSELTTTALVRASQSCEAYTVIPLDKIVIQ